MLTPMIADSEIGVSRQRASPNSSAIPAVAPKAYERVAETLRREIADRPIPWAGEALTVTASFGITQALPGEINIQAIIGRADAALYRAKEEGRNCVRIASETLALIGAG